MFYIFFSIGQVLLSILSWCFACTSVSEGVFLIYPWREMYSTSTTPPPSSSLHSVIFEIAHKYYVSGSFVNCEGYSISSKGFLPTVVEIMVI